MLKTLQFPASRTEALHRLKQFVPDAGKTYAARRNYDLPHTGHSGVSRLSPYLRHRLITEAEVVQAVLARHSPSAAEKFIQEVFWRTYWKGWLELRPAIWGDYLKALGQARKRAERDEMLGRTVTMAETGGTDIDAFNAWARELVETGYLHNHARMWFASVWIFTLKLPWELGADFFMRHLIDGDPASNTLSWRWVAGLQTPGKHYLARASNISKYTDGRHNTEWRLNTQAGPLKGPAPPAPRPAPTGQTPAQGLRTGLLLTEEDLSPGHVLDTLGTLGIEPVAHAGLISVAGRSPGAVSTDLRQFTETALADCLSRWSHRLGAAGPVTEDVGKIVDWVRSADLEQVVTAYAPVGPTASRLRKLDRALAEHGIAVVQVLRDWDREAWPHATRGFFKFKGEIPDLLARL